jgi:hypothetical protein
MTKRRLSEPHWAEPEIRKGPSVALVLACALGGGMALGLAFDTDAYTKARLGPLANIGLHLPDSLNELRLPESLHDLQVNAPHVLGPIGLNNWPSWLLVCRPESPKK